MILQHNLVFESKRFKNKWYKGVWIELQGSLVIIKEGAFWVWNTVTSKWRLADVS